MDRSERPHISLTLSGDVALLAFTLPNRLTPVEADRWLNAVNDGLGWKDPELRSYAVPSGTVLAIRGSEVGRPSALGRYRRELEVGRIEAQLRKLTPEPALVVRGNAATSGPTPSPQCQGIWKGNRFLFYDLSSPASISTLRVSCGISGRLQRATVALVVGWALFPTLVFSAVLWLLASDPARAPKQQWEAYRRWLKPLWLATVSGFLVTLFLLLGRQSAYVLGPFMDHGHSLTPVWEAG